jgi:hypothetical protein
LRKIGADERVAPPSGQNRRTLPRSSCLAGCLSCGDAALPRRYRANARGKAKENCKRGRPRDWGVASFDHIRYRRNDGDVFLYAFDLIELNGDDLRRDPLDVRKATLRSVLTKVGHGIRWNEHIEGDAKVVLFGGVLKLR